MKIKKQKNLLPNKPSELIEVALVDYAKVKRSKKFVIDMGDWYTRRGAGICHVCLAGAVMAKTLQPLTDQCIKECQLCNIGPDTYSTYLDVTEPLDYKLYFLNTVRVTSQFDVDALCRAFGERKFFKDKTWISLNHVPLPVDHADDKGFKARLKFMAQEFKKLGL